MHGQKNIKHWKIPDSPIPNHDQRKFALTNILAGPVDLHVGYWPIVGYVEIKM